MKTLIKNGRLIDPYNEIDERMDILIGDGVVKELGEKLSAGDDALIIVS